MSSIVANQRVAFLACAQDDARRLVRSLANLSDAQRAAVLAILAADTSTPVDFGFICDEGDFELIALILDGRLTRGDSPNCWLIGSGCEFVATPAPGTEHHYD